MAHNRVFFPQAALDAWLQEGRVELSSGELRIAAEDRRYKLVEAVRILQEVGTGGDEYGLVGRVKTLNFLQELGAELLGTSMVLGDSAYDVVPGFLGSPIGSFAEHRAAGPAYATSAVPQSEQELLAAYLIRALD
ncbi:MAG TPA: hypothetical protein VKZ49_02285 [Polyangiaceae bacterium]|nr:hypothetical protein [Polyangiaceae bacterium]